MDYSSSEQLFSDPITHFISYLRQIARLCPQAGVQGRLLEPEQLPGSVRGNKVGEVGLILTQPHIEVLLFPKLMRCPTY